MIWADFPFAAVGEQFGLVGCATLLTLFAVVLVRIWRIAHLSRDLLGTYLCAGVFTMLLWQVFQNIGMTVKIMPVTGLADAVHLLRRLQPDHVVRPARGGAERPHAPHAVARAGGLGRSPSRERGRSVAAEQGRRVRVLGG